MKLKALVIFGATALLSTAFLPTAFAQDAAPAFDRDSDRVGGRHRGHGPRHQGPRRPGGNPENLLARLDANEDGVIDDMEFLDSRLLNIDRQFDRLDRDDDGLISEQDAPTRRERPNAPVIGREAVAACVRETLADWEGPADMGERFEHVDTSGDGYIDFTEFSIALEERAYVLFDRLDGNDDGVINLEELVTAQDEQANVRRIIRACIDDVADPFEPIL